MDNKYKELFQSLSFQNEFRPAVHIHYLSIDDYASELLSCVLERDIRAEGKREEFYYWSIEIRNGSITGDELEKLYDIIGANEHDKTFHSYEIEEDGYITELCQVISQKLFSKIMPFEISVSFADDEGIWMLGGMTDATIFKNIQKGTI